MSRFLILVFGLLIIQNASAQWCGTDQEALHDALVANLKSLESNPTERGVIKYIPVTFHLVANSAGNGRVEEENVLKQVANFNSQFADQEFIFYIDRFNYFDNDATYENPYSNAAKTQMRLRKDNNSVNIYITNNADDGSGPGMTLAYYDPNEDWIVTRKNEVNGSGSTLAHEVGHFFTLKHTHYGWDCVPYTEDDYTNPVNQDFTDPCAGGGGSVLIELHNRSNCATAGDLLCDTPEDYNLGLLYQTGCAQNTTIRDKNNELITPMTNNYMSYYNGCASYQFTQSQKDLIATSFNSNARLYIRTGVIPETTPVTGPVTYISPINGQESNGTSEILLDWDDTPGANKYLVIYARNASFTINPKKVIVNASSYTIPDVLNVGDTYYWKVWPYNESQTGAMYSPTQNFKVGEGVNEISDVTGYNIQPNPSIRGESSILVLNTVTSFDAELVISDASGKLLTQRRTEITSGYSEIDLQTEAFTAGMYFVMLKAASGTLVERFIISN